MIKLNLIPFTLPPVTQIWVTSLGEPFKMEIAPETFVAGRHIRYELRDANGAIRELGEVDIPESIYAKCGEVVMGDLSNETLATLNAFFQQAGWINMVAINPPEE